MRELQAPSDHQNEVEVIEGFVRGWNNHDERKNSLYNRMRIASHLNGRDAGVVLSTTLALISTFLLVADLLSEGVLPGDISTPFRLRRTMDLVVSAHDESPSQFISHVESCCPQGVCRLFVYLSNSPGTTRSHSHENVPRGSFTSADWNNIATNMSIHVDVVDNSWTGTESTGYMKYIVDKFEDLADTIVFAHGHVKSRHSGELCLAIRKGLKRLGNTTEPVFVNINNWHSRRCVSRTKIRGPDTSNELRDSLYKAWHSLMRDDPKDEPIRFTWECCAQFIATQASIRRRSLEDWIRMFEIMSESTYGGGPVAGYLWEYLWPTIIDERGNVMKDSC